MIEACSPSENPICGLPEGPNSRATRTCSAAAPAELRKLRSAPVGDRPARGSGLVVRAAPGAGPSGTVGQLLHQVGLDLLDLQKSLPVVLEELIELPVQLPDLQLGLEVHLVIVLGPHPVPRLLPVLTHHDDGRLNR